MGRLKANLPVGPGGPLKTDTFLTHLVRTLRDAGIDDVVIVVGHEKDAVLGANPTAFFTIPHFDGYAAVLIQLKKVTKKALHEAIVDGWLACAPPRLTDEYLTH